MNLNTRATAILAALIVCFATASYGFAGGNGGDHCNAGRGNGSEQPYGGTAYNGAANDCDPGNSGAVNHGGDYGSRPST